jgi:hypothetical protein
MNHKNEVEFFIFYFIFSIKNDFICSINVYIF